MPRRDRALPNPFYVLLLLASTAFVVTVFAYLVAPTVIDQAPEAAADGEPVGTLALAGWLERRGPAALAVEIGVMAAAAALAMLTDHLFDTKAPGASS